MYESAGLGCVIVDVGIYYLLSIPGGVASGRNSTGLRS